MGRFLIITGFLIVAMGILIQSKMIIPWASNWIGKLPGDLTIKKGDVMIYLPITTSLAVSLAFSLLSYLLFGPEKKDDQ